MTQQLWEDVPPPAKPPLTQAMKMIAVIGTLTVILVGFNFYPGMHDKHPAPPRLALSPLALQQLRPVLPQPVDPDDFNETRDGSNALIPEDENGKASIWHDTKSGARIFCLDSCIVLPVSHHHHRRS